MERNSAFSYSCSSCGSCCHDKLITLSPYDLSRIAQASGLSTSAARERYTDRRGLFLKFNDNGACSALGRDNRCTIYEGRPLACRIYPLGVERAIGGDSFETLEPAVGSKGKFGVSGTINEWLEQQGAAPALDAIERYQTLLPLMRAGIGTMIDIEKTDTAEFRRRALRQAMSATEGEPNRLIDALYDADLIAGGAEPDQDPVAAHVEKLEMMIWQETNPEHLAAAAVMLAVSLGQPAGKAFPAQWETENAAATAPQPRASEASAASPSAHARRIFGGQQIVPLGRAVFRNARVRALLSPKPQRSEEESPAAARKVTGTDA